MTPEEYAQEDAVGLAGLVRSSAVKPVEVIEAAIARAEAENPRINAVVTEQFDAAREAVARFDPAFKPLAGVPLLLKDGMAQAGVPCPGGSRLVPAACPQQDAELLRRYRHSGLVVLGRANMPEWGLSPATEPAVYGPCRNPWHPDHSPGGSSGGSAAAVAAGIAPVAGGGDGAGSIRIPAACCGLVGLKPTRQRTPNGPGPANVWGGLVVQHALTRTVRDCAALLDIGAGYEPGDVTAAPIRQGRFLDGLREPPASLRIAFCTRAPNGAEVHSECIAAVERTIEHLTALGHRVEPAELPADDAAMHRAWTDVAAASAATDWAELEQAIGDPARIEELEPVTRLFIDAGRRLAAADVIAAERAMQREARSIARFHETWDLYLTPTLATPPPPIGRYTMDFNGTFAEYIDDFFRFIPFTAVANMTGQPAISLPLHRTPDDLPVGVQFTAPFGEDALLLRLAAQLEEVFR